MTHDREFDVIVFGATGFTGRLVAEHMLLRYGVGGDVRWAIAGRSASKLALTCREIGAPANLPHLVADAAAPGALEAMARRAKVVITTVGPYQLYGAPLVAACADTGTDYVDLCGEPAWMAAMISRYQERASASGARIVFSCGFDSIPFDLGVTFLQEEALRRFGAPLWRVHGRVRKMKGGFSGGTVASLMATMDASQRDPSVKAMLADPFALTPGFSGPAQTSGDVIDLDMVEGQWAAPFIMAEINTKNVHRSNFLLRHAWGRDFVYDEMMLTGEGAAGEKRARAAKKQAALQRILLAFGPARAVLRALVLPKPGQGPSREERETGFYEVAFHGETRDGRRLRASCRGDRDPGYGSTARMIAESALCLARDVDRGHAGGGVWTPGAALGQQLITRLEANAGMSFRIENATGSGQGV